MKDATAGLIVNNVADGDSRVRQQIGMVRTYKQQVVHDQSRHYHYASDSPDQLFEAALKYLATDAYQRAAALIEEAHSKGLAMTGKVVYYWHLALLGGKPFDQFGLDDLTKVERAHNMARECPVGEWRDACAVMEELMRCFTLQIQQGKDEGGTAFVEAISGFDKLPTARRNEMSRHLALLFTGGLQDRLDDERRRQIRVNRPGNGRRQRVPKFFEPEPAPVRTLVPRPSGAKARHWISLAVGASAWSYASMLAIGEASVHAPDQALVFGLLLVGGSFATMLVVPRSLVDSRIGLVRETWAVPDLEPGWWHFPNTSLDRMIAAYFRKLAPRDLNHRITCLEDLNEELETLSDTLDRTYLSCKVAQVSPRAIAWLAEWHVRRLVQRWKDQHLDGRSSEAPGSFRLALTGISLLTTVIGIVGLLATLVSGSLSTLAVMILALASFLVGGGCLSHGCVIYAEQRRLMRERREYAELVEEERAAWRSENARLADRPSDTEMAEWLAYDKDDVRFWAVERWNLKSWHILSHVVLIEPMAYSTSARVQGGPRRYSQYRVRLFLLTNNGVRRMDVVIDFASGDKHEQQRHAFRYDAIASAQIEEPAVRLREESPVESSESDEPDELERLSIQRQSLSLTLVNGVPVDINADYQSLMADEDRNDPGALLALEMETSGAVSTLRALETVAGEGREWLRRERERTRRVASEYRQMNDETETG